MNIPMQITIRDVEHSEALDAYIRNTAKKLNEYINYVMAFRVVIEMPHKYSHQGKQFNVRIDIGVPGGEIVVSRDHHEDVYVALRDAFYAAKRLLEGQSQKVRGEVKSHQPQRAEAQGYAM